MALDDVFQRYLTSQRHGRLATVGPDGHPQNKPVGFHYNAELGTIDIAGIDMEASAKYRNVGARPDVAFVVDDVVAEGAAGVRFAEIRGPAEQVTVEPPRPGLRSKEGADFRRATRPCGSSPRLRTSRSPTSGVSRSIPLAGHWSPPPTPPAPSRRWRSTFW